MEESDEKLLEVQKLQQYFKLKNGHICKAVDDVSFTVMKGETYGLAGESGSGKSTIGRAVIGLYQTSGGKVKFNGSIINRKLSLSEKKSLTEHIQMIFQDPISSLNPHKKVIDIIAEGMDNHHLYKNKEERNETVFQMMEKVGLNRNLAYRYPHQFSGGQRQRIGIARAFAVKPELIIADEAISALDVSVQAQIVNLMKKLQKEYGTTYIFIAHDLAMVRYISDHIGILHKGHIVETGTCDEIFEHPIHPYTKSLLSAIPQADPDIEKRHTVISYDYEKSKIDYTQGNYHWVDGEHYILSTKEELNKWLI